VVVIAETGFPQQYKSYKACIGGYFKMGILSRFKDMSANINALLDKAEDPEKMIDQTMRNLTSDLAKVKEETAAVMADEQRCKRELDECNSEMAKMQAYAEKALLAGNEADAMKFLQQKNTLAAKQASLQQTYDVAAANAMKMRQMHDKLVNDINELNSRRDAIKAKIKVAKTQERMNKLTSSMTDSASSISAFERYEAKANNMLDKANAMSELNMSTQESGVDSLAAKYDAAPDAVVKDQLEALKAQMGLQ
jgi:phage shock protein A